MTRSTLVDPDRLVADLIAAGHESDLVHECLGYAENATELERSDLLASYATWRGGLDQARAVDGAVDRLLKDLANRTDRVAPRAREAWQRCVSVALTTLEDGADRAEESSLSTGSQAGLGEEYLSLLLAGNRKRAMGRVLEAVDAGLEIESLYLDVFQPVLAEIGHRWETGRLSVGQEHYCSAVTQSIMSQLGGRIFSGEPKQHTLVAASVMGNLHEIGIRMISDLFELGDWDTYYLGADTPDEAIVEIVEAHCADVLAISVMLTSQLSTAARTIEVVRNDSSRPDLKIILGGRAFVDRAELATHLGADAPALSARGCVRTANRLVSAA